MINTEVIPILVIFLVGALFSGMPLGTLMGLYFARRARKEDNDT